MKYLLTFLSLVQLFYSHSQPLNGSISLIHGAGCNDQSGELVVQATGGNGTYSYSWSNGSTNDTISGLGSGSYSVQISSGMENYTAYYFVDPFGVVTMNINNACNGGFGSAQITEIAGESPIQIHWYNSAGTQISTFPSIGNLQAGEYSYSVTDSEGCVDSSSVLIVASTPVLEMFAADSALCWGESTQVWYTPGFILTDGFATYDSSTDTIVYTNYPPGGNSLPSYGIDQYGCQADITGDPIVFLGAEPNPPLTIYNFVDTLSLEWGINLNPSSSYIYDWYFNGILVESYPYSYLAYQGSGTYHVNKINQYGCYNTGTIQVNNAGIDQQEKEDITFQLIENPVNEDNEWRLNYSGEQKLNGYLYNPIGQIISEFEIENGMNNFGKGLSKGFYILCIQGKSFHLIKE